MTKSTKPFDHEAASTGHNRGNEYLPENCVHLWYAFAENIRHESLIKQLHVLSLEERGRWEAFRFDGDRHHYLAAHLLLRYALCRYLSCLPQHLQFTRTTFGKPALAGSQLSLPLEFNLTHTHGLVACAVARHPVGIDAEWLGREIDPGIASSVLCPAELQELSRWSGTQQQSRLLEYWTLKEAFVKATGRGMSQPLDRFWFRLERTGRPGIGFAAGEPHQADQWQFVQYHTRPDHVLAVAVKLPAPTGLSVETRHLALASITSTGGRFSLK